jgi:hypothetical protein
MRHLVYEGLGRCVAAEEAPVDAFFVEMVYSAPNPSASEGVMGRINGVRAPGSVT